LITSSVLKNTLLVRKHFPVANDQMRTTNRAVNAIE